MAQTNVRHILAVATYGFVDDDPHNLGSIVTKERVSHGGTLIERGAIPPDVLVPFPQKARSEHGTESLGESAAAYARSLPAYARATVLSVPASNGTWDDTLATYELARHRFGYEPLIIHFVSDPTHLFRIRMIWWFTKPPQWRASFWAAKTHRGDAWKHEPKAYLHTLCKGVWYRLAQI